MTQLPPKKEKFKYISEIEDIVGEQKKKKKKNKEKKISRASFLNTLYCHHLYKAQLFTNKKYKSKHE